MWLLGDATCEKIGDLIAANGGPLLGLYDELSTSKHRYAIVTLILKFHKSHHLECFFFCLVTGDANFTMGNTCLTVGGFSQPSVAWSLIEQGTSAKVGPTQHFLWSFPKPTYSCFCTLEVDERFTDRIGKI